MRMRKAAISAALVVVAGGLSFAGARPAAAFTSTQTKCDDATSPITGNMQGNVEVPKWGVCHIHGYTILGNVEVDLGGKLFTRSGTEISGSIQGERPMQINLEDGTTLGGDFRVVGTAPGAFGGFACGVSIGGNVILKNLRSGTWVIGEPSDPQEEGGQFEDYDYSGGGSNDPDLTCESPNTIKGDVRVTGGDDVNRVEVSSNSIGGSMTIKNNDVVNEFIELEGNTITGELTCRNNEWDLGTPAISAGGQPNTASGFEGQCAG